MKAGCVQGARTDRAARRPQQHVERLLRAAPVEDVAGPQREFVGEAAHQVLVDPLELDAVDDAFVDRHRQDAGRVVELRRRARKGVAFVAVEALDCRGRCCRECREGAAPVFSWAVSRMARSAISFDPLIAIERTTAALVCGEGAVSWANTPAGEASHSAPARRSAGTGISGL